MHTSHQLLALAEDASKNAYCTYSHYPVGAVLEMANGDIITGCNVENASFGLTMCAERSALFAAVNRYGVDATGKLAATQIGIWAKNGNPQGSVTPCGACRQVMAELFPSNLPVCMIGHDGEPLKITVSELLPASFNLTP
jgi:cytidine deaminase